MLLGFLVGLELVVVANDIFLFLGLLLNGGEGVLVGHDSSGGEGQLHGLVFLLPAPQVLFLFVEGHDVVHILFGGHAGVHELEHIDVVAGDGFLGVMGAVRGLEGGAGRALGGGGVGLAGVGVVEEVVVDVGGYFHVRFFHF